MPAPDRTDASAGRTAYGFAWHGVDADPALLGPQHADAPAVTVRYVEAEVGERPEVITADRVERRLLNGYWMNAERATRSIEMIGRPAARDMRVHPYLAAPGILLNRWKGRETFHASAFGYGGSAWVVTGPREAGKSSLVAQLDGRGIDVVTDDMAVTDGANVYAGPRCVDLRVDVPGARPHRQTARESQRERIVLPPLDFAYPLGGWVFPRWGDEVRLTPMPPSELLAQLAVRRHFRHMPSDSAMMLELAGRPAWWFERPRAWPQSIAALDRLLGTVATAVGGSAP